MAYTKLSTFDLAALAEHNLPELLNHIVTVISAGTRTLDSGRDTEESKLINGSACPYCNAACIVKHGRLNGHQRFRCRSCGRTYNTFSCSVMANSKLSPEKWLEYSRCILLGYSVRKSASITGVGVKTSFLMRRKILEAISSYSGVSNISDESDADEKHAAEGIVANRMQTGSAIANNATMINYDIEYASIDLPRDFPVIYFKERTLLTPNESELHFHNHLELGYCYEGFGVFLVNDKVLPFSPGDVSIIFPNQLHIAKCDETCLSQWRFVTIDPISLLPELDIPDQTLISRVLKGFSSFINIINKNNASDIPKLVLEIATEAEKRKNNYVSAVKSLVWLLIVKLAREFDEYGDTYEGKEMDDHNKSILRIAPVLNYISEQYMNPISLDELASILAMSASNFRRLFKEAMTISPSEYILHTRIKKASILLLNTDYSILKISIKVGYPTLSGFNRHFKKVMGVSPSEWKKQLHITSNPR